MVLQSYGKRLSGRIACAEPIGSGAFARKQSIAALPYCGSVTEIGRSPYRTP